MKSKTIIISAPEENNTRGILTLFQEDDLLKCRLRVYNLEKISRYCKLGIYHQNEVFSANLIERNNVYESSFVGNFDIDQDFYTALIDTEKNNQVLLAGGTYQGFYFNDNSVFLESENFSNTQTKQIAKSCAGEAVRFTPGISLFYVTKQEKPILFVVLFQKKSKKFIFFGFIRCKIDKSKKLYFGRCWTWWIGSLKI